jgi:hypothetical protein
MAGRHKHAPTGSGSHKAEILMPIRTVPGATGRGKPFDFRERRMVEERRWKLELIPAEVLGLARPLEVETKGTVARSPGTVPALLGVT